MTKPDWLLQYGHLMPAQSPRDQAGAIKVWLDISGPLYRDLTVLAGDAPKGARLSYASQYVYDQAPVDQPISVKVRVR